nr:MAG TPA: hypothetical protein [Caudoviricetes sp.]
MILTSLQKCKYVSVIREKEPLLMALFLLPFSTYAYNLRVHTAADPLRGCKADIHVFSAYLHRHASGPVLK